MYNIILSYFYWSELSITRLENQFMVSGLQKSFLFLPRLVLLLGWGIFGNSRG
jgi:hypothetical protein|tara:strand:+ start:1041 stop:1199 length:159 start_codon:yes stop_codon:yes gene_type:complete